MRRLVGPLLDSPHGRPTARDWRLLALVVVGGLIVRLAYLAVVRGDPLVGDLPQYDLTARLFGEGKLFWSDAVSGEPHPSAWKPPGYWLWIGSIYTLLGATPTRVGLVQVLVCGPLVIALTFLLARRLAGPKAGAVAAVIVALHPNVWQLEPLMYPEAIAPPLVLLTVLVALAGPPSPGRAAAVGVLIALNVLIRPSALALVPAIVVAWMVAAGVRPAIRPALVALGCTVLVVLPWTIRNAVVLDGFVPISVQDAALAGTFNPDAANDERFPFAWRPIARRDRDLLETRGRPVDEAELRSELLSRAREFIADNPDAVPRAFFWNGISRTWELRRPSSATFEAPFEGRRKPVTLAGYVVYWLLVPFAIAGLVLLRRDRKDAVALLLTLFAASSVLLTAVASTRYRAPLEPLIAVLAATSIAHLLTRRRPDPKGQPSVASAA